MITQRYMDAILHLSVFAAAILSHVLASILSRCLLSGYEIFDLELPSELIIFAAVFMALYHLIHRIFKIHGCQSVNEKNREVKIHRTTVENELENVRVDSSQNNTCKAMLPLIPVDTESLIIRYKKLNRAYGELKGFLEVLNMISSLLGRKGSIDDTMERAVKALGRIAGSEVCMILLLDSNGSEGHVVYGTDRELALRVAARINVKKIKMGDGAHRLIKIIQGPGYFDSSHSRAVKDLSYLTMKDDNEITGLLIMPRMAGRAYSRRDESVVLRAIATLLIHVIRGRRIDEKLRRVDRLAELGRMSASIAHEIRNPLGGIEILSTFLSDKLKDDKASADMAADIAVAVKKLERIVGGLLEYARDEQLKTRYCQLSEIVENAVSFAKARDINNTVEFNIYIDYNLPDIFCDPDRLSQALMNLFINSVLAFSNDKEGGVIILRAREHEDHVIIEVEDNGPGIPEALGARIFEPFVTGRATGTGLGLPITKKIVESHGGVLEYDIHRQKGTLFRIILPLRINASAVEVKPVPVELNPDKPGGSSEE